MTRQLMTSAACFVVLATAASSHATILGFGQLGGSNTTIPVDYGSNATADASGLVVTNGTTPDITVTWDVNGENNSGSGNGWDIHTSDFFAPIENATVGGGDWDNEGPDERIAQLDFGQHSIGFAAAPDAQLVLNSFDFGHTSETSGVTEWDLALTNSSDTVVWSQAVTFNDGMTFTITPDFTGAVGEDYVLSFTRTSETYGSNGRHALDNLSFNQIPEPSAISCVVVVATLLATSGKRS